MESMRELYEFSKPTFASCWGFQAMARAMGGEVVTDIGRAELGTLKVSLTPEGKRDQVFSGLGDCFLAQMGHQDIVDRLPGDAIRLASTDLVENQAFCFAGKPIYCTQFHPELNRKALMERVRAYPQYIERIAGVTLEEFTARSRDTPESETLLPRFIEHVFGQ
jgi:GMP synthase (glutamine-hydrolysing)